MRSKSKSCRACLMTGREDDVLHLDQSCDFVLGAFIHSNSERTKFVRVIAVAAGRGQIKAQKISRNKLSTVGSEEAMMVEWELFFPPPPPT